MVLGALRLEELEARRHAGEEIAHLDAGAGIGGRGPQAALGAAIDGEREGLVRPRARATGW